MKKLFEEARKVQSPIQPGDYGAILDQKPAPDSFKRGNGIKTTLNRNFFIFGSALISSVILLGLYFYGGSDNDAKQLSQNELYSLAVSDSLIEIAARDTGNTQSTFNLFVENEQLKSNPEPRTPENEKQVADSQQLSITINADGNVDDTIMNILLDAGKEVLALPESLFDKLNAFNGDSASAFQIRSSDGLDSLTVEVDDASTSRINKKTELARKQLQNAQEQINRADSSIKEIRREREESDLRKEDLPMADPEVLRRLSPLTEGTARPAPSEETLRKLGITIENERIIYRGDIKGAGGLHIKLCIDGTNYLKSDKIDVLYCGVRFGDHPESFSFYPEFVTDASGELTPFRWKFEDETFAKLSDAYLDNMMDVLIPIHVKHPDIKAPRSEWIFWFMPDASFAEKLEQDANIGPSLTQDDPAGQEERLHTDIPEKEAGIVPEVYPNPVYDEFTVRTFTTEETTASFSLYTVDGRKITNLKTDVRIAAGKHKIHFDKPDLADGVYLLRIDIRDAQHTAFKRVLFGY